MTSQYQLVLDTLSSRSEQAQQDEARASSVLQSCELHLSAVMGELSARAAQEQSDEERQVRQEEELRATLSRLAEEEVGVAVYRCRIVAV